MTEVEPESPETRMTVDLLENEEADSTVVKEKVLQLARQITDLLEAPDQPLEDHLEAETLAYQIKPHIDRLCTLKRVLNPVERIVERSDKIKNLQSELERDMEELSSVQEELDPDDRLVGEVESQLAALKDDSKIVVREVAPDDRVERSEKQKKRTRPALLDVPVVERMEQIFGDRFVPLEQIEKMLSVSFTAAERDSTLAQLHTVWKMLFESASLLPYVRRNYVKTLQRTFSDFALIFRSPIIGQENGVECSIKSLRHHFPSFFPHAGKTPWYARYEFYERTVGRGHWALVDRQHLNCTFRKPLTRLQMFAEANNLSTRLVRQKSVVEDVYDRIVLELALRREYFSICNSLTRSAYVPAKGEGRKNVYVYTKDGQIRVSGKKGMPHWRLSKARWPGVLPTVVFDG